VVTAKQWLPIALALSIFLFFYNNYYKLNSCGGSGSLKKRGAMAYFNMFSHSIICITLKCKKICMYFNMFSHSIICITLKCKKNLYVLSYFFLCNFIFYNLKI